MSCTYCNKVAVTKERRKAKIKDQKSNKVCEKCFFCRSLCFCSKCSKCPQCCKCPTSGGTSSEFLGNMGSQRCKPQSSVHFKGGLCSPLQSQTSLGKGSPDSKWLCKPHQRLPLARSCTSSDREKGSREGQGSNLTSLFQQTVHCPKAEPQVAADLGSQYSKSVFMRKNIQNGDSRDNPDLSTTRGVGDIARFQRRLLSHSNSLHIPKIPQVPLSEPVVPVSGTSLWPVNSSHGVHGCGQRGQVNGSVTGYKNPPVPRRRLIRAPTKESCHQGTQSLLALCQELGWMVNMQKSELEPQQVFDFVGYQYDLLNGVVRPTQNRWEALQQKITVLLQTRYCRVRTFMSLIGLLTATEKQVPLGRLHMRPIQWHLKKHWRVPESLEKEIPIPRSLHQYLQWWTQEENVLKGQPLHPLRHAVQIFTDASKEGWGAHLGDFTASGTWSVPESKLHINFLELKAVLLALKRFQHLVQGKVVLIATDNTTVVAYINKEGGMRSGSLCALLWRLLCWCNLNQIVLKARHIPGRLNVIADKLSRQKQVIQTEWSLHEETFDLLCQTWHSPLVDMFATRYNCKLVQFVSPIPDPKAWSVDALTLSWEDLDMYLFPPVSLMGKVVSKLSDHWYRRAILIAPGWPNMPWFWDLVELSARVPLCLSHHPDLVTQPFNKARHRDLTNLNLHAWLLEPRQSRSRGSLAQWRQELRRLKDVQPEQSTKRSGPFLSDGAKQVRWTSGTHL